MGVEGRVGGMVGGPPIIRRDIASTPPPPRRHACPEPLNVGFVCVTVCRFGARVAGARARSRHEGVRGRRARYKYGRRVTESYC